MSCAPESVTIEIKMGTRMRYLLVAGGKLNDICHVYQPQGVQGTHVLLALP